MDVFTVKNQVCLNYQYLFQEFYPVNRLRNVALRNTQAKYVFMIDADFLPNSDLYDNILDMEKNGILHTKKVVLFPSKLAILNLNI